MSIYGASTLDRIAESRLHDHLDAIDSAEAAEKARRSEEILAFCEAEGCVDMRGYRATVGETEDGIACPSCGQIMTLSMRDLSPADQRKLDIEIVELEG